MTLKQTRQFIYQQMVALKAGEISIDEALMQSKLAGRIIDSYTVETKAIELAASLDVSVNYPEGIKQIEG